MLKLTERWKQELDFKIAFDSVCYNTLALKLQANGMRGNLFKLITDYLTDRKQYLEINGKVLRRNQLNMECLKAPF